MKMFITIIYSLLFVGINTVIIELYEINNMIAFALLNFILGSIYGMIIVFYLQLASQDGEQ